MTADHSLARLGAILSRSVGLAGPDARSGRREVLAAALAERMAACAAPDREAYLDRVEQDPEELQRLLDDVLVGETSFWRNPPQMQALREQVLPAMLRTAAAGSRRLHIWSAGCSTGEEPYTLAMMLAELVPHRAGWDLRVVGTDVSARALAAAQAGEFGPRSLATLDPARRSRWLVAGGSGRWLVRDELRELVELRRHNLVTEPPAFSPASPADVVVCRNVTIYFDRPTTTRVIASLRAALAPGGVLVLGHSETLWKVAGGFTLVRVGEAFLYRKGLVDDASTGHPQSAPRRRSRRERSPAPRPVARRGGVVAPVERPAPTEPGDATTSALLADATAALTDGDYEAAVRLAARCAELAPMLARAHYLEGLALVNLGRYERAVPVLRRAVYADPGSGFAHFLLATVQGRLGDAAGAAASYRNAAHTLGTRPGDDSAHELGGRTVSELAQLCEVLAGDQP